MLRVTGTYVYDCLIFINLNYALFYFSFMLHINNFPLPIDFMVDSVLCLDLLSYIKPSVKLLK
jgi:hypothetical protein